MGLSYSAPAQKKSKYYAAFEKDLPSIVGKIVLITGCTSGTGYAIHCINGNLGIFEIDSPTIAMNDIKWLCKQIVYFADSLQQELWLKKEHKLSC